MEERHQIEINNKRAFFEYAVLETIRAGIVLRGTEIKAIREGKANLSDAYCMIESGECRVYNLHISEYRFGSYYNHEVKRTRKLLLHKKEIRKLERKSKEKGFTLIPIMLYIDERGFAKLEVGLCKGKHAYDKRESIKQRETNIELQRSLRTR